VLGTRKGQRQRKIKEEETNDTTVSSKAVKVDDARLPVQLWNNKILEGLPREHQEACTRDPEALKQFEGLLEWIRCKSLKVWKKFVIAKFWEWFHGTEHLEDDRKDIKEWGMDMMKQVKRCSWWEWQGGSTIFFWRWPKPYQDDVRIGIQARFDKEPPEVWEKQPPYKSGEQREKVSEKS